MGGLRSWSPVAQRAAGHDYETISHWLQAMDPARYEPVHRWPQDSGGAADRPGAGDLRGDPQVHVVGQVGGLDSAGAAPGTPARVLRSPALPTRSGSGPRRSGQLRPNRGQRGPWKHPEPAAQGPRGPKQGVLRWYPLSRSKGITASFYMCKLILCPSAGTCVAPSLKNIRQKDAMKALIPGLGLKSPRAVLLAFLTCPGYSTIVRDLAESGNSIPTTDALISLATRPSMPCISFAIASRTFWTTCGTL